MSILRAPSEQEIMEFAVRLAPVYALLEWRWSRDGIMVIPSIEQIAKTIRELSRTCETVGSSGRCRSGGISVDRSIDDDDTDATEPIISFTLSNRSPYA